MPEWYFVDVPRDPRRYRYHNFPACLFVAALEGRKDRLKRSQNRMWPGTAECPTCTACGLPIDLEITRVEHFYNAGIRGDART